MTKRMLAIAMAAMLVILGSISAFAATEPKVTSDAICYLSFQAGSNDYDGQTMDTAKKQFLGLEDTGCTSVLANGGTLYVCGKAYMGADYVMPELGSTLLVTSNDGKVNYKNSMPIENPACALKMKAGATWTLQQDTIIDDIILFQESTMNTIAITNNSTLVIGDKVECISNLVAIEPCYMAISVEKGSTVILNGGTFEQVTGEGTIINNGATIISEQGATTEATEATTKAPETTTKAPDATTKAPETTTAPAKTTESTKTSEPSAVVTSDTSAVTTDAVATESTTAATSASTKATTEATKKTEPASTTEAEEAETSVTTAASEPAPATEGGLGTGAIVGIVIAVIAVVAIVVVVVVKKKKN